VKDCAGVRCPFRLKLRNTRNEQIFSAPPPITDILGGRLATVSSGGMAAFIPYPIFHERRVPSALPRPEQTDKIYDLLPVGNWFYSFVIEHEIPFANERPLRASSGRPDKDAIGRVEMWRGGVR
jgi:hypothetical protein